MTVYVISLTRRKRRKLRKIFGFFDPWAGGFLGGGSGSNNWILRLGDWNDAGVWDDNSVWKDEP